MKDLIEYLNFIKHATWWLLAFFLVGMLVFVVITYMKWKSLRAVKRLRETTKDPVLKKKLEELIDEYKDLFE